MDKYLPIIAALSGSAFVNALLRSVVIYIRARTAKYVRISKNGRGLNLNVQNSEDAERLIREITSKSTFGESK